MKDTAKEPGISVGQILIEASSFSHRPDYLELPITLRPDVGDVSVNLQAAVRTDGKGGLLRIRVETSDEANPIYRFAVTVVGVFEEQAGQENMPILDFINGPAIPFLFPFVREAVANLTGRGRFGPVWLNPINAVAVSNAMRAQLAAKGEGNRPSASPDPA